MCADAHTRHENGGVVHMVLLSKRLSKLLVHKGRLRKQFHKHLVHDSTKPTPRMECSARHVRCAVATQPSADGFVRALQLVAVDYVTCKPTWTLRAETLLSLHEKA